jgi:hypothetical protein
MWQVPTVRANASQPYQTEPDEGPPRGRCRIRERAVEARTALRCRPEAQAREQAMIAFNEGVSRRTRDLVRRSHRELAKIERQCRRCPGERARVEDVAPRDRHRRWHWRKLRCCASRTHHPRKLALSPASAADRHTLAALTNDRLSRAIGRFCKFRSGSPAVAAARNGLVLAPWQRRQQSAQRCPRPGVFLATGHLSGVAANRLARLGAEKISEHDRVVALYILRRVEQRQGLATLDQLS